MVFSSCGTFYCLDTLMDEYIAGNQGNKRQKITKHMNQFVDIITFSFIPYSAIRQTIFDSNLAPNTESLQQMKKDQNGPHKAEIAKGLLPSKSLNILV